MLNYCIVKQRIGAITEDTPDDDDRYPDYTSVFGQVVFAPTMANGSAYKITDDDGVVHTVPATRITAQIINGEISHEGQPGLPLFAAGPNANPSTIVYTATYINLTAAGLPITLNNITFRAVPGETIDLSSYTPVAGAPTPGIIQGPPGHTPFIGQNGNWWISGKDTGVAATSPLVHSYTELTEAFEENTLRVKALEAMNGVSPESPVDGQTADLINQPGTLTRSAVSIRVESIVDGRFLPNDNTYSIVPRLVHHGMDSRTPRPETDGPVIWLGTPLPIYSQPGDVLLRPAGSEAAWAPDWLNLVGWYDPSALTPGSSVIHVEDRSGHENHLDIPGGTGQIAVDGSTLAHPSLYFDGESWISSGLLSQGRWTHPTTVWVVMSRISTMPATATIFDSADIATGGQVRATRSTLFISDRGRFSSGAGTNHFGTNPVPEATPTLLMMNFAGDSTTFGEINGQLAIGPLDIGDMSESDSHRLGANGSGDNQFKGSVGEVIVAHGVTESDREATTSYLMEKWGIA